MPELPEVETTRRGIEPHLCNRTITAVNVYQPSLRWPVPKSLQHLVGRQITNVSRRGKYLLVSVPPVTLLIHLGMSGSLRMVEPDSPRRKHDHIELRLDSDVMLRYHDPRRFGCWLVTDGDPHAHELLAELGPEPLGNAFHGDYLFEHSRNRKVAVKNFIMNSHIVVGVGNIYASEALFLAGLRPGRAAGRITKNQYSALASTIRAVLTRAIEEGGTTLRDFVNASGEPGYFAQTLNVYGRDNEPCRQCGTLIKSKVIGQRSSYYCPGCQS